MRKIAGHYSPLVQAWLVMPPMDSGRICIAGHISIRFVVGSIRFQ